MAAQSPDSVPRAVVQGTVRDTTTGRVVQLAIIRVTATGASTLSDEFGRYRILAPVGEVRLEVRRIGLQPSSWTVPVKAPTTTADLFVRPLTIELSPIEVVAGDDEARRIMARAIARRSDVLSRIHDYQYQAYVKLVVRNLKKPRDSAQSVLLITETRTKAYWQQPDQYQETILARRQSSNIDAGDNVITVGQIVNFNRNRVPLGMYSLVSPVADDALQHYNYAILDTLDVDGRKAFRLAIVPGTASDPLFSGMIDVADSTWEVLRIDAGVNDAVRFAYLRNIRYRQDLRDQGDDRWMPSEIRFSAEIRLGGPLPSLAFEHTATLSGFRFDQRSAPSGVGEVRVVVADTADHADSSSWAAARPVPLTDVEQAGWQRIDSLRHRVTPGRIIGRGLAAVLVLSSQPEFFRFNRVDGLRLGAAASLPGIPQLDVRGQVGYATGSHLWQTRFTGQLRVAQSQRTWVGASFHDESVSRPTLISRTYNPTLLALTARLDPLDYFREVGITGFLSTKLLPFTQLDLEFNDLAQSNLSVVTDYALFDVERLQRLNPDITEGRLRSATAALTYDSRPWLRSKGRDRQFPAFPSTRFTIAMELSLPDLGSDFAFRRYSFQFERRQRSAGLGSTTIGAAGGIATGTVPPQRYFTVDFGLGAFGYQNGGFSTLAETNFSGTRAAMVTLGHDFDRLLFRKSRIPGLRSLPFTLTVHGGVFWTDFANHVPVPGDNLIATAAKPYVEAGFGIGNLTPFLLPFNFAIFATWQLSSYPTRGARLGLGLTRL